MPRLIKGAKWTFGWVVVGPGREIVIPPEAWEEYGFEADGDGFSALMLLFEPGSVATQIIHNGLIYVVCGAAIPWGYTILVERNTPVALGIKRERWGLSLILSLAAASLVEALLGGGDVAVTVQPHA